MRTPPKKSAVIATLLSAASIAGLMLAHAQEAATASITTKKNPLAISSEMAAELQTVEQLPTVEPSTLPDGGRGATYYSAQCPYWPPLPGNVFGLSVWDLGGNCYLIDDLSVDYEATTATATTAMVKSLAVSAKYETDSTDLSATNGPYLTISPTGTNGLYLITVFNDTGPVNYELWYTPVLANADYPWTAVAVGTTGQTNFTVNITYPTGFYRAVWDTNSIPLWEAADPNNPSTGILTVFIDSPTNGAVLQ
jgi:hypothetical protein